MFFDCIIKIKNLDFGNILLYENLYKNLLVYEISYKTLIGAKRIRLDKVDGFIRVYDGTRYLVLFAPEKHDAIYNRIMSYVFSHNYTITKIDSYDSLPLEKGMFNVIILIKPVCNESQYH